MRTGNSILVAFFVWLAIDLPIRIFALSETYVVWDFAGIGRDEWMVFSVLLSLFLAVLSAVLGMEKQKDMDYKKPEKKLKKDEVDLAIEPVEKKKNQKVSQDTQDLVEELKKKDKEKDEGKTA